MGDVKKAVRAAKASTYLRVALACAKSTPGGIISTGQVAYLVHRKARPSNLLDLDHAAEKAMRESGLFMRAGDKLSITNWKLCYPSTASKP